jgi:hypothetical protein
MRDPNPVAVDGQLANRSSLKAYPGEVTVEGVGLMDAALIVACISGAVALGSAALSRATQLQVTRLESSTQLQVTKLESKLREKERQSQLSRKPRSYSIVTAVPYWTPPGS